MTQYIFTIGSGKNGTHTVHEIFHRAKRGSVVSQHEPRPYLDLEECLFYEGRLKTDHLHKHWSWKVLVKHLRTLGTGADVVHVANNHYTTFVRRLEREFPGARFILPVRADWEACVASTFNHGFYDRYPGLYPSSPARAAAFHSLPRIAKVAWMVRTRVRLAKALMPGIVYLATTTEGLADAVEDINDLSGGALDLSKAREVASNRHGASDPEQRKRGLEEINRYRCYVDSVARGELDEEIDPEAF